jgi:hypothetical protein
MLTITMDTITAMHMIIPMDMLILMAILRVTITPPPNLIHTITTTNPLTVFSVPQHQSQLILAILTIMKTCKGFSYISLQTLSGLLQSSLALFSPNTTPGMAGIHLLPAS